MFCTFFPIHKVFLITVVDKNKNQKVLEMEHL